MKGYEFRPIVLITAGTELCAAEIMVQDRLVDLYGMDNVKVFSSADIAEEYLETHRGVRCCNFGFGVVAIYSLERENELRSFFQSNSGNQKKLLIVLCGNCRMPADDLGHDDSLVLSQESDVTVQEVMRNMFGLPFSHRCDPKLLIDSYAQSPHGYLWSQQIIH